MLNFMTLNASVTTLKATTSDHGLGRTRALWLPRGCATPCLSFPIHVGLSRFCKILTSLIRADRMTTAFVDFNGVVPEKFDAVRLSHLVDAEYGNQGIDFKMVPREGFGWMNGTLDTHLLPRLCLTARTFYSC